jgi:hypothetical protein
MGEVQNEFIVAAYIVKFENRRLGPTIYSFPCFEQLMARTFACLQRLVLPDVGHILYFYRPKGLVLKND